MTTDTLTAQQAVNAWNLRHPVGTPVRIRPTYGKGVLTTTRSAAWVRPVGPWTEDGIASISVAGQAGVIPLTRIEPAAAESAVDGAA